MTSNSCLFCKIIQGEITVTPIKENDFILVFPDLHPKAPIHYLIIPKNHIIDLAHLTEDDHQYALEMVKMVTLLGKQLPEPQAFNVISNNGAQAGQSVFHLHWHFLAGKNLYKEGGLAL